jgi:hypothetical protein
MSWIGIGETRRCYTAAARRVRLASLVLAAAVLACAPPPAASLGDACALPPKSAVAETLGARVAGTPETAGGAVESACRWSAPGGATLTLQLVSTRLIRASGRYPDAATFFNVTAPLAGTLYETNPSELGGIGERAVWAGRAGVGQLWVLQGDTVVGLLALGVERPALERFARAVVGRLVVGRL